MKIRKFAAAVACILLLTVLCAFPASAVEQKVYDKAGLLSATEETDLQSKAEALAQKSQLDIVIVTIDDNGSKSSKQYADDFYDQNNFGYGADHSGLLLLIDMDARIVWLSTTGQGIRYFTDARIKDITDTVAGYLKKQQYSQGCNAFLQKAESYINQGIPANQHNVAQRPQDFLGRLGYSAQNSLIYIAIAVAIGGIAVGIMIAINKKQNTVSSTTYLNHEKFHLTQQVDRLMNKSLTHYTISSSSGDGGGGGGGVSSTHTGSSGTTHGGGGSSF